MAERGGFEPPVDLSTYDGLANRCFRPLSHLSVLGNPIITGVLWSLSLYHIRPPPFRAPHLLFPLIAQRDYNHATSDMMYERE